MERGSNGFSSPGGRQKIGHDSRSVSDSEAEFFSFMSTTSGWTAEDEEASSSRMSVSGTTTSLGMEAQKKHHVRRGRADAKLTKVIHEFQWYYFWIREVYGTKSFQVKVFINFMLHEVIFEMFTFEFGESTAGEACDLSSVATVTSNKSKNKKETYEEKAKEKISKIFGDRYNKVKEAVKKIGTSRQEYESASPKVRELVGTAREVHNMSLPPVVNTYGRVPPMPWGPPDPASPMIHIVDRQSMRSVYNVGNCGAAAPTQAVVGERKANDDDDKELNFTKIFNVFSIDPNASGPRQILDSFGDTYSGVRLFMAYDDETYADAVGNLGLNFFERTNLRDFRVWFRTRYLCAQAETKPDFTSVVWLDYKESSYGGVAEAVLTAEAMPSTATFAALETNTIDLTSPVRADSDALSGMSPVGVKDKQERPDRRPTIEKQGTRRLRCTGRNQQEEEPTVDLKHDHGSLGTWSDKQLESLQGMEVSRAASRRGVASDEYHTLLKPKPSDAESIDNPFSVPTNVELRSDAMSVLSDVTGRTAYPASSAHRLAPTDIPLIVRALSDSASEVTGETSWADGSSLMSATKTSSSNQKTKNHLTSSSQSRMLEPSRLMKHQLKWLSGDRTKHDTTAKSVIRGEDRKVSNRRQPAPRRWECLHCSYPNGNPTAPSCAMCATKRPDVRFV